MARISVGERPTILGGRSDSERSLALRRRARGGWNRG